MLPGIVDGRGLDTAFLRVQTGYLQTLCDLIYLKVKKRKVMDIYFCKKNNAK
jgi:hypothetical protein